MSSWRFTYWRSLLSIAIAGTSFLPGSYALAQIVPDAFIGNMSNVTQISNDLSIIVGGTQVGNSLFHSFSQLSVPTGNSAYFNNPLGIENIFTRVTGNNISNIDGLIRTNGTANLFLVNPNGIVFGSNPRLDIGGSFAATTASGLKFADGNGFNAINPQTPPLSIIPTQGLQYRESQPGATITTIGNLKVGQDLTFVADKIDLQGNL
ncbi:filamentous hemagglutinin N-terminal domain-containing protein [Nostoc flagelliforme]|uniref:filamentous hemagglutinin N-terminal domain-containing protein n=1 Tax=Nostoc flagelliforme TaxID=1306274 RepID=UPI000C2D65D5|nr:filamentous hemagglutinin N-terminal domain-containing protein [Nostoc flagelliforme]